MCIHIYIYMYTYIHIYIYTHIYKYIYIYTQLLFCVLPFYAFVEVFVCNRYAISIISVVLF